jgi:hypothetical protein
MISPVVPFGLPKNFNLFPENRLPIKELPELSASGFNPAARELLSDAEARKDTAKQVF